MINKSIKEFYEELLEDDIVREGLLEAKSHTHIVNGEPTNAVDSCTACIITRALLGIDSAINSLPKEGKI